MTTWASSPGRQGALFGEQQALFDGNSYYTPGTEFPYLDPQLLGNDDVFDLLTNRPGTGDHGGVGR